MPCSKYFPHDIYRVLEDSPYTGRSTPRTPNDPDFPVVSLLYPARVRNRPGTSPTGISADDRTHPPLQARRDGRAAERPEARYQNPLEAGPAAAV